ncbi:hypothetical protein ACDA63_19090 [Uliginosibacterium sp. sgz301328]|uniref:ABC-type transport auxiliary lipoprotein family protein n=1 Tax=Uliginosibacterium sp. sgz301328 TaxID=3243764 RepID=UPI00359DFED8
MPRTVATFVAVAALSACTVLPEAAPRVIEHDLGAPFAVGAARSPVALRALNVTAQPMIAGVTMFYRDAREPTRRGAFAFNRWSAPPAAMVDAALNRLLAVDGGGRCRLQVTLGEFIIDVDAAGKGQAMLSANLRLAGDPAANAQTIIDIAVPMTRVDAATGAAAMRQAVNQLGADSAAWLASDAARSCRG